MSEVKDIHQPKVEISVKNFGPIAEADIDLRPLTVFVGPSNTGKTYFVTLVYALHGISEGFAPLPLFSVLYQLRNRYFLSVSAEEKKAIHELDNATTELLKKIISSRSPVKFSDIPQVLSDYLQSNLTNPKIIGGELNRCFDLKSVSDLIQFTGTTHCEMQVFLKVSRKDQEWWNFNMITTKSDLGVEGAINTDLVLASENESLWNPTYSDEFADDTLNGRNRYYLPAARSGILQSHRVMASSLMERAARSDNSRIPTLSAVVADFMKHLPLYEADRESNNELSTIANVLESELLAGKISAKPLLSGYPEFFYQPHGTKKEIHLDRTSSMVSELAPLVLFLRGLIQPGDTLIIEEPEAHLHPGAQADMAVILARLVRAGVRVIITTHSDWMLQEIGNLIRIGELEEIGEKVSELPISLQKEQVGVWHFQKNGKVEEISYDRINGVEPMEYLDVAEDLYNRSARLQNRLEEMKGGSERE